MSSSFILILLLLFAWFESPREKEKKETLVADHDLDFAAQKASFLSQQQ